MKKLLIMCAMVMILVSCSNSTTVSNVVSEPIIQTKSQECVVEITAVQPSPKPTPEPTPTPEPIIVEPSIATPDIVVAPIEEPVIEVAPPVVVEQSGSVRSRVIDASSSTLIVQSEDNGQQYAFMYQSAEITGNIYVDVHVEVFYIGDINTTDSIDLYVTRVVVYPT